MSYQMNPKTQQQIQVGEKKKCHIKSDRRTYSCEFIRKTSHQVRIGNSIQTGIQNDNNATNIGTGNRQAQHSFDIPLVGTTRSFKLSVGHGVNVAHPRRPRLIVHPPRQATAHIEAKLLRVVPKTKKVELLVGRQVSHSCVVGHNLVGGAIARVAQSTNGTSVVFSIDITRHPEIHVFLKKHGFLAKKRLEMCLWRRILTFPWIKPMFS